MPTIPSTEPARINAGDTARWLKALPDYPASADWVLGYELVSAANRYTFSAAPDGDNHLVNVAAATTAAWVPGSYAWRARVSLSGEVFTVGQGHITVDPSFGSIVDARGHARKTLDAIEAVLENRASSATAEYQIAGRSLKYIPIPELLALRDRYRQEVAREEAASRLGGAGRIYVRFGP
jgi:hypothetical protein